MIIFFSTLGALTIVYGIYSTVKSIRNKRRSSYRRNVIRYTIQNKYPIRSNYSKIKNSLLS